MPPSEAKPEKRYKDFSLYDKAEEKRIPTGGKKYLYEGGRCANIGRINC